MGKIYWFSLSFDDTQLIHRLDLAFVLIMLVQKYSRSPTSTFKSVGERDKCKSLRNIEEQLAEGKIDWIADLLTMFDEDCSFTVG